MNSNFVIGCSLHKCNKSTDSPPHATLIELLTESLQKHSPGGVLKKKGFLDNFAELAGRPVYRSIFLIKLQFLVLKRKMFMALFCHGSVNKKITAIYWWKILSETMVLWVFVFGGFVQYKWSWAAFHHRNDISDYVIVTFCLRKISQQVVSFKKIWTSYKYVGFSFFMRF